MRIIYGRVTGDGREVRKYVVLKDRKCEVCGAVFSPHKQSSRYCSKKCSLKASNKRIYAARKKQFSQQNCAVCGKSFIPKKSNVKCCSPKCSILNSRENSKVCKDRARHGGRRQELIEQYGSVCSSCGKEIKGRIHAHHTTMDKTQHEFQELLCCSCHTKLHISINPPTPRKILTKEQIEDVLSKYDFLEDMCKSLGVTRSFLYKKRMEYGLPLRVILRGRKQKSFPARGPVTPPAKFKEVPNE